MMIYNELVSGYCQVYNMYKPMSIDKHTCKALPRVQVIVCTATMPEDLASESAQWLQNPERIHAALSSASVSRSITQVCASKQHPSRDVPVFLDVLQ